MGDSGVGFRVLGKRVAVKGLMFRVKGQGYKV